MFKSSIGPVKKFCGTSGGSPAALGRPKKFPLPKNELKSLVSDKNWPGVWRKYIRMYFQHISCTKMHFVSPKNFIGCSGGLRPHIGASKTEYFFKKWQKWKKMVNFLFKKNVFQMFSNRLNFMSFNSKESQLQNVLPILFWWCSLVNHLFLTDFWIRT